MKNLNTIPRIAGAFPNVTIVAETAPGAKDGTPLHSQWGNELFSALQAILNGASLTPSGTVETCGATAGDVDGSQIVEALQLICCPPGTYHWYAGDTLPTGSRLLKCTGTLASRTYRVAVGGTASGKYQRLLNVWCGAVTNWMATSYYRTSDAAGTTRADDGDYMVIPNLDGCFMRSRDLGKIYDPQGDIREFGDIQTDALQQHHHEKLYCGADEFTWNNSVAGGTDPVFLIAGAPYYHVDTAATEFLTGNVDGPSTSTETRPNNTIGCLCVSY